MISLEVNSRDNKTKGELTAIRKDGKVPAIIYGGKEEQLLRKKTFYPTWLH